MTSTLLKEEHTLETPPLIGTSEEKMRALRFWTDIVALIDTIDSSFESFENKQMIIAHIKKEVDLIDVAINNISATVVDGPGEIPSAEQVPSLNQLSPPVVGTNEERIRAIRFWADFVGMIRSLDISFESFQNKQAIIAYIKKEVDLIQIEIDNISASVISKPGEIPSTEQLPDDVKAPETNIVDLSSSADVKDSVPKDLPVVEPVANPVTKPATKVAPTFSDLDKLRRVAGVGATAVVPTTQHNEALDRLQHAAGAGRWK
jgi:hypothetical protein